MNGCILCPDAPEGADGLCADHATVDVLHAPTLTVGRVARAFAVGEYVGENGRPVDAPVLVLERGDAFVADRPSPFLILPPEAAAYYRGLVDRLAVEIAGRICAAAAAIKASGASPEMLLALTRAAISAQLRALSRPAPPDGGAPA